MLGEMSGFEIDGEHQLMTLMSELAQMKAQYDKVSFALHEVMERVTELCHRQQKN